MGKSFYKIKSPKEALKTYVDNDAHLYGRMKNKVIWRVLDLFVTNWKTYKILEIGAAGGIWTQYFINKGAEVTCVDLCEPILKANKMQNPDAITVLGDATNIKLDERFDLIFAKDVIEHIEEDETFLANMNHHLVHDGLIIINTQNSLSLNYLIQGGYHYLRGNNTWLGWDPTHVRFYTPRSLRKKLRTSGFEVESWFGSYYFPYRLITERMRGKKVELDIFHSIELLGLERFFPVCVLGWNIGVVGRKTRTI